jgi:hypothetical protein
VDTKNNEEIKIFKKWLKAQDDRETLAHLSHPILCVTHAFSNVKLGMPPHIEVSEQEIKEHFPELIGHKVTKNAGESFLEIKSLNVKYPLSTLVKEVKLDVKKRTCIWKGCLKKVIGFFV